LEQYKNNNNEIDKIKNENKLLNIENNKLAAISKAQIQKFEKIQSNYEINKKDFKKQLGDFNLEEIIKKKEIQELKDKLEQVSISTKLKEMHMLSSNTELKKDVSTEKISDKNDEKLQEVKNELESLKDKYDELLYKHQIKQNIDISISDLSKETEN